MAKSINIQDAIKLARTREVGFENGLIRTDNNEALGYLEDLHNTEVDKNGNVRRRKGSVAMNSGTLNEQWYFLESYEIAGVQILFGLSYKRELWAWIDAWPEIDFKVCSKDVSVKFPHFEESVSTARYNFWLAFSRGTKFSVLKTDQHMTIVNNFNDAIRIYAKGCLGIAQYQTQATDIFIKDDIEAARTDDVQLGLYLSVKDVTNKIIESALTVKTDNMGPLLEGTVEFASMNDEGTISRFTDPEKIETSSPVFSIFDAVYFKNQLKLEYKKVLKSTVDGGGSVGVCAFKTDYDTYGLNATTWSDYYDVNDGRTAVTDAYALIYDSEEEKLWLVYEGAQNFSSGTTATIPTISEDTRHCLFQMRDVHTFMPRAQERRGIRWRGLGDFVLRLTGATKEDRGILWSSLSSIGYVAAEDRINLNTTESSLGYTSTWYEVDLEHADAFFDVKSFKSYETSIDVTQPNIYYKDSGGVVRYSFSGAILFGALTTYAKPSDFYERDFDTVAIEYPELIFQDSIAVFEHLGFNTWEVLDGESISASDITDIDNSLNLVIDKYDDKSVAILDNENGQAIDFLENGYRWCVKNGEYIVAESQVGFLNQARDNILYELPTSTGIKENGNEILYDMKPCYMPVLSLHGSTLTRYVDADKNKEVVYDADAIINIDEKLIVIQDGAFWVGNADTLKLSYDKAIQGAVLSYDAFYNGVLVGTTEGLYYYRDGKIENVIDGQNVKAVNIKSGKNGALVVDDEGKLSYAYIMVTDNGFFVKLVDIHGIVSEMDFTDSMMTFVDNVFYITSDDQIFGFYVERLEDRTIRRFDRVIDFPGQKIGLISEHNNRLIVSFKTGAVKSDVFEKPYDGVDK